MASLGLWHVAEVHDESMMLELRIYIYFFAADVGKDPLGVSWVFLNEPPHFRQRRCNAFLVRVIKRESHSKHDAALKALTCVCLQNCWILMPTSMEEKCGDLRDTSYIERPSAGIIPLCDVNHAHDNRSAARPLKTLASVIDRSTMDADPSETGASRITLGNGVCRDEAEGSGLAQDFESFAKEMCDLVGVAMALSVDGLQEREVVVSIALDDRVLSAERRIANDRIEARIIASEHFGEFQFPVE